MAVPLRSGRGSDAQVHCPAQQCDILLSHRQCHTSVPTCSRTRKCQCSVANCAFPSLLDPFQETGQSEGAAQRRVPETDGDVIPLVSATTIFIGEFLVKEKELYSIQQPPRQVAGQTWREDKEKKEHNALDTFDPTYMYDAMKEKRQLRDLLVRFCVRVM
jgi:hypothetical protein